MKKNIQTRKALYLAITAASQLILTPQVLAGPEGGRVVGGSGSIAQSGLNTTIQQQTDRMAIDWQSFNVAADERVQFIQPSSSSLSLNRVLSHAGSEIHGRIEANGHILLVNPNGVFFGENSHINVGGMIASGLGIDPAEFMNGEFTLTSLQGSEGKVINAGIINAATGGSVSLIGQQVKNEGVISARLGAVNLAAGKEAVVTFDQQGLVGVRITKEILQDELGVDAALINSGEISAEGGRILLSASTSQDIFSQAVNHGELNSANSVVMHEDGSFTLGAGADVINTGSLDVSSSLGDAGQIVVIGENITHSGQVRANTGTGNAGNIELHSVDTTRLTVSANIAAEAAGTGGKINILGNKVGLFDEAQVSVSGTHGGGEVLVGGDESGTNTRIRNADFIYLGQDTQISADGILDGHGGKIITFASDTARIHGELSARGGEFGGNGGFIETSGLKGFELSSTPRISSPTANGGTWLIDPYNISISSNDTNNIPLVDNVFTSSETGSVVYFDTLKAVLNSAGNEGVVIVRTGAGGDGEGNISLLSNIEYDIAPGGTTTLRLEAHNNIIFGNNSYIRNASDDSGKLNVELIANLDGDTNNGGNIIFNQGSYIRTSGGYFSAGVRFDTNEQGELVARPEDIATPKGNDFLAYANNNDDFATIDTSTGTDDIGGTVIINMGGDVSAGSSIVTGGAGSTVLASSSFTNNFSNATINTSNNFGGGDITINSTGDVNLGAVDFSYLYTNEAVRSGSVTVGSGGDVYLHENIDFNNTEIRGDVDPNNGEDSSLVITSVGDINIIGSITDSHGTDDRDIFDITLDAGGAVDIQGSIATSGGNVTILNSASVTTADDGGASISTLGTYEDATTFYGNVVINSTGAVSIGSAIDTAGGTFTVNSSSEFSNNFNDGNALISTGGGVFSVTSSGAVSIGSTVATSGGDFVVVESGSFNSNINDAYIDTSTSSSAPVGAGGGDIQINANGNIILGLMDFTYAATTNDNDTVRVGSVTATAGGNITLARLLNYNDTGPRDVDAEGTLPNHGEEVFIDFSANGDINIDALIYDRIGDARDLMEVRLAADADNTNTGTVNINADIYTSGGTFTASGSIFDSSGFVVNTDHANSGEGPEPGNQTLQEEATWSDGGDITISASSSITLGQLVTDSDCLEATICTGNLTVQGRVAGADSPSISQTESLSVAGSLTVDVGAGSVTLTDTSNSFTGPLIFNNAGTVELVNANIAGTVIGQSTIGGDFTLTSGGEITQFDETVSLLVSGQTSLNAANNNINLSNQTNDFIGVVNVSSVGSIALSDSNDLSIGDINTSGNSTRVTGDITLSAGGNLVTGAITANGPTGNTSNRDGGQVTLSANNNIEIASISAIGAEGLNDSDNRTGGSGGTVSIVSNNGLVEVGTINTDGGNGHESTGGNNRNGGQAGNITITAQAPAQHITLNGNLTSQGGLAGNPNHQNGTGGNINFSGSVQLANNITIDAGVKENATGDVVLGNIVFNGILNSDNSAPRNLNLVANDITFRENVGEVNRLGLLDVNAVSDVTAQSVDAELRSLDASTLIALATGFYTGDINTFAELPDTTGGSITVAAEDISIGAMNSSGTGVASGGSISVTASGENASITLNGDINALSGDNSAQGNVDITLASAGSVFLNPANFFTSMINIIGSSGDDTLHGFDIDSRWTILSDNQGNIGNGNIDSVSFSDIEHLVGGSGIDTFSLNADITGSIDGDDGNDVFNIASNVTSALMGGDGDDAYNILLGGITADIDGGSNGNDTVKGFNGAINTNFWTLTNANAGTLINNGATINFSGIETLEGGTGNDILQGRNQLNNWQITGNNEGTLAQRLETPPDTINFSAIENLSGGNLNDYFTFGISGFISGLLTGGGGSENAVTGRDAENQWNITSANEGAISDLSSNSEEVYLASFQNIQVLNGGSDIDTFVLNGGNVAQINGGGSVDSLQADNLLNTWVLVSPTSGTLETAAPDSYLLGFSDVENLNGNNQIDTFIFAMEEEYNGIIDAVGDDNIVSIAEDVNANIAIVLGESINGVLNADIVMGNGLGSITVQGDAADVHTWEVNDVGQIVAEADGENDGLVSNNNGDNIRFIDFANLIGSEAADNFSIFDGASITGTINGGSGSSVNTLSNNTSNSTWVLIGSRQGDLTNDSNSTIAEFTNIHTLIGSGSDSLVGRNQTNDWQINASNGGYVQINGSSADRVEFSGMQNITGGAGSDYFTFLNAGIIEGTVTGGNGADTLISRNTTNIWLIDGVNQGRVTDEIANPLEPYAKFQGVENLVGGSSSDTFSFSNNGSIVDADGGDGIDSISFAGIENVVVTLGAAALNGVRGIEQFIGNGATSTLKTANATGINTWTIFDFDTSDASDQKIDGLDDGEVNLADGSSITFIDFSNLEGGSGTDIFTFDHENSGSITGSVSGGADGDSTIIGRNATNTWQLSGTGNSLGVTDGATYVASFSGIQTIQGGNDVDIFAINNAFVGSVLGGAGDDVFHINASVDELFGQDGNDQFNFTSVNNGGHTSYIDGGVGQNILTGRNIATTWQFTGTANYLVSNDNFIYVENFSNIQTLQGGNANDTFVIDDDFGGNIYAGAGADVFIINASSTNLFGEDGDDDFDFTSTNNAGSASIIDGGGGENTLQGRHTSTTWNLNSGANSLSVSGSGTPYVTSFSSIQLAQGGSAIDTFNINSNYLESIAGGGNADIFYINAEVNNLYGESGDDQFTFSGINNTGIANVLDGGTGNDILIGRDMVTVWALNTSNTLTAGSDIYVGGIVAIETLQGGDAVDTFNIENDLFNNILGGANNDIFNINALVNSISGEAGDDQFIFSSANNAGSADTLDGGNGNDMLVGRNIANSWLIDDIGSSLRVTGSGSDYVQLFTDMQILQGGNNTDTYNVNADFSGNIFAGAGNDVFNINATVNLLAGEAGNDQFLFNSPDNAGNATSIQGGDGENTLVGRNLANTWNIAASGNLLGATNGITYVASFEDIQLLQGGSAIDEFNINSVFNGTIFGGDSNDLFVINAAADTLRGEDGNDQFIFSSVSNAGRAERIVGGNGDDTVIGRNATNNWNLTTAGNSLADSTNTYVTAFEDVDILQGGSAVDNFLIDTAFDGEIRGGSGDDLFSINAFVNSLFGEAGNDQFEFSSVGNDGSTNSINGGDGENRLIARNLNNTWNLSSGNNLGVSGDETYVADFINIQILQGGNAIDQFLINAAFNGNIYGGDGNDIFTINADVNSVDGEGGDDEFTFASINNAGAADSIDGGAGTNILQGRNADNTWALTGSYSGSLAEDQSATNYVSLFNNIHTLEGGTAEDTLIGQNQTNEWSIDDVDAGSVGLSITDTTLHLVFTGMENIVGGRDQDNFVFSTITSDITGLIDGGTNGNNLIQDTLDISVLDQAITVELFDSDTDNLHVMNMEQIIASDSYAENNYLYGASDRAYIWTIDDVNAGSVARADSPSYESTTRFVNFGQLRGGENNDRFEVITGGSIAGTIHGGDGEGIDFADYSNTNSHVTVALGGDGSLGVTGINGIEGVVGNNGGSGDAQFNSVMGITSGNNVWTIGSFDSVTDGINDGQIAITLGDGSSKIISFENFNILSGGSGNDEFNFSRADNNNGLLLGYINGGMGTNTFNAAISANNPSASIADQVIHIKSTPLDLSNLDTFAPVQNITRVFGFTSINANATTNSTLVSAESANTWNINANGTNNLATDAREIAFAGFTDLVGGTALDTFNIRSLEGPLRVIDGGSGTSLDTVDFSQLDINTSVIVGVGETVSADINILDIERVNAHNHASNELVSDAATNVWRITDANTGSLNADLMFSGFANLTGTIGDDSFIFADENASLSGVMDGGVGAGLDSLDLTALDRDVSLQLTESAALDGEMRIINLEQVEANSDFVNTLLASNADNTWSISGNNIGSLSNESSEINFIGFRNLVGGSGNDQFIFFEPGSLDGFIDGSTQPSDGEDSLDMSRLGSVDILLADSGLGYRGIERVIGNDQDSTIRRQGTNTWNLMGQNSGNINGTVIFEGFTALVGGEGNDQFNLTQGSLAGSASGGMGNDTFTLGDAVISGGIYGEGGDDLLETAVASGTTGTVNFSGGTGNNSLTTTGGGAGFTAQHTFTSDRNGQLRYLDSANNGHTISYSDVTGIIDSTTATSLTINTTATADNIVLRNRAYTFNDTTSVTYNNKNNLVVAASSDDQVIVSGAVNIPQLLTIQDAQVSSTSGGSIVAAGLRLDGTATVGSENNRINVNVNDLYIRSTSGAVYLNEQNTLNISEFSANGLIDLRLDGDLTSSIALSSAHGFNAVSTNGNLILDKENALSGALNLSASGDINLRNLTATNIANISARQLTINSNGVINGNGLIEVSGLSNFVSGGNINLDNREHNFNSVQIGSAAGVSINNIDTLNLIGVAASGTVNINAQGVNANSAISANSLILNGGQGAVTLTSNIDVAGEATISGQSLSVAGDIVASSIQLNAQGEILLNGELNTDNGQAIAVNANNIVQNGRIIAGTDVRLTAVEGLTQNANIAASNRIILEAGTDLLMSGSYTTQADTIDVTAGGILNMNMLTAENGIRIEGGAITQQGNLSTANGDINVAGSNFAMDSGVSLTAATGAIYINSDADLLARDINAGTDISLAALGDVQLNENLVARAGAIDIQGRNIDLAGDLSAETDINIVSTTGALQQQGLLQSQQGNIAIDVDGDLVMASNSETQAAGSIIYRAANIAVTGMKTEAGAVTLTAHRGAVTDSNGENVNVTAQRLVIDAETGIGASDVIETLVSELSVSNNQGDIRLQNSQEVTVDRLRSNGNIVFNNLSGSVTLDNTNGLLFSRNEPDARAAGGTMNANYDIGTLTINVAQGDLAAINTPNLNNPDIVARNAALIAPTGNIGSPGRPLVIYVKDSLFIGGLRSWSPLWGFDTAPQFVENTSTIQGNLSDLLASGNEQLVAVETLEEVNPAIFTSVRNYFYDDISILLPRDQLYYDDEYE